MTFIQILRERRILVFFIFLSIFPTIRALTIGSSAASTLPEFAFAMLPELLLFTVLFSYWWEFRKKEEKLTFHLIDKVLIAYIVFNLVIGFILTNDYKAAVFAVRMTYLPMVFYFLVSFSNFNKEKIEQILRDIFLLAIYIALIGVIMFFFFPEIPAYFNKITNENQKQAQYFIIRMTSLFWTPVVFAVYMAAALIYWHFQYLKTEKPRYLLYVGILFSCICLAVSRGAMISVVLGVILTSLIYHRRKLNLRIIGVLITSFIAVGFYVNDPLTFSKWIISSTADTVNMEEDNTRSNLIRNTMELLEENPMGMGLGKAGHVAVQRFEKNRGDVSFSTTDCWYIKLILETGYLALLFFLVFLTWIVWLIFQHMRKKRPDLLWFVFVFIGIIFLHMLVSNTIDFYLFSYIFWFILGIVPLYLKKESHGIN